MKTAKLKTKRVSSLLILSAIVAVLAVAFSVVAFAKKIQPAIIDYDTPRAMTLTVTNGTLTYADELTEATAPHVTVEGFNPENGFTVAIKDQNDEWVYFDGSNWSTWYNPKGDGEEVVSPAAFLTFPLEHYNDDPTVWAPGTYTFVVWSDGCLPTYASFKILPQRVPVRVEYEIDFGEGFVPFDPKNMTPEQKQMFTHPYGVEAPEELYFYCYDNYGNVHIRVLGAESLGTEGKDFFDGYSTYHIDKDTDLTNDFFVFNAETPYGYEAPGVKNLIYEYYSYNENFSFDFGGDRPYIPYTVTKAHAPKLVVVDKEMFEPIGDADEVECTFDFDTLLFDFDGDCNSDRLNVEFCLSDRELTEGEIVYKPTIPSVVYAGEYYLYYRYASTYYEADPRVMHVVVKPLEIAPEDLVADSLTFNGKLQTVTFLYVVNGEVDYEFKAVAKKDAADTYTKVGTYSVTLNDYKGSVCFAEGAPLTVEVTVDPLAVQLIPNAVTLEYGDEFADAGFMMFTDKVVDMKLLRELLLAEGKVTFTAVSESEEEGEEEGEVEYKAGDACGAYTVKIAFKADDAEAESNFAVSSFTGVMNVVKRKITPIYKHTEPFPWDGEAHDDEIGATFVDIDGNTVDLIAYTQTTLRDIGDYRAYVIIPEEYADRYVLPDVFSGYVWSVVKADYDMSGVSFDDWTILFGDEVTVALKGTLPTGIDGSVPTVTFSGADSSIGHHTVTAHFATDSEYYNAPADMTAVLTVRWIEQEYKKEGNEGGKADVIVKSSTGVDPSKTLVAKIVEDKQEVKDTTKAIKNSKILERRENVVEVYEVSLYQDNVKVQPDGTLTIYLNIPTKLAKKEFRIIHVHNDDSISEIEYTSEDGYAVINTDKLSSFVFVADTSMPAIFWLLIEFVALAGVSAAVWYFFIFKRRKEDETEA